MDAPRRRTRTTETQIQIALPHDVEPEIWQGFTEAQRKAWYTATPLLQVAAPACVIQGMRIPEHQHDSTQQQAVAQLLLYIAAVSAAIPTHSSILDDLSVDGQVLSVTCAPLGWDSLFNSNQSACIATPSTTPAPAAPAARQPAMATCLVRSEPPWIQFDRDANDALVGQ